MTPVELTLSRLARPQAYFGSDNAAGVHPELMAAVARANEGFAPAYGYDQHTQAADDAFCELFGRQVAPFYVWHGTGANVMALADHVRTGEAVICTDIAHINVDETGAPERMVGAKLLAVPHTAGKLTPDAVHEHAEVLGSEHAAQPAVVSITQSTEFGTVYTPDEIGELAEIAHAHGMTVHMDGARLANAVAALGGSADALRACTIGADVDVISFGGTKNGMMYGEAVVYLDPERARRAKFVRKAMGQLPSKMRFIAAQFDHLLRSGLWLRNATHANSLTRQLASAVDGLAGVRIDNRAEVNALFATLDDALFHPLCQWAGAGEWIASRRQVRWMTSWATEPDDVARLIAGITAAAGVHESAQTSMG